LSLARRGLSLLAAGGVLGIGFGAGRHLTAPAGTLSIVAAAPLTGDFTDIARRSAPAVVNISAVQVVRTERSPFFSDPFFRDFFGRNHPFRVPHEERKLSLGSGVVVSPDGVIVTNHHVVGDAEQIEISVGAGKKKVARLVGKDAMTDIAVIRVADANGLEALPWGDSARARVGEYVLAVGNPFRLSQTVTMGIISAVGRSNVGIVDYEDFIQTDAAINPGNSGGALVNVRGELIGINTAIYSETGGYQGIGFAVPANLARQVVGEILEHGHVVRGSTGITHVDDLNAQAARRLGLSVVEGVIVLELLRGSPADRAGLRPGDVVLTLNDREIKDAAQFRRELAGARVGSEIHLGVLRNGRRVEVRIRVEGESSDA
jgi:Do/DeqQ family serine protease